MPVHRVGPRAGQVVPVIGGSGAHCRRLILDVDSGYLVTLVAGRYLLMHCQTTVGRRRLKLKAYYESMGSYFGFKH